MLGSEMTDLVLRDIDPMLVDRIRRISVARGWTQHQTVINLIEQGLFASSTKSTAVSNTRRSMRWPTLSPRSSCCRPAPASETFQAGWIAPRMRAPRARADGRQVARPRRQRLRRQPSEAHRFHVVRIQAVHLARFDHRCWQPALPTRPSGQGLRHAAAADQHPACVRLVGLQRIRRRWRLSGPAAWRWISAEAPRPRLRRNSQCPIEMRNLLAAGALGRRQREPRLGLPLRQQVRQHLPTGGKRTVGVERLAGVALAPGIHQGIGRAGIEATHHALPRDQREDCRCHPGSAPRGLHRHCPAWPGGKPASSGAPWPPAASVAAGGNRRRW